MLKTKIIIYLPESLPESAKVLRSSFLLIIDFKSERTLLFTTAVEESALETKDPYSSGTNAE